MRGSTGEKLIQELLEDSAKFDNAGRAYQLLQECFHGFSLEALRPLLSHNERPVRRSVAFVVSELGREASSLIDDVVPLVYDVDAHTKSYVFESILVCGCGTNVDKFVYMLCGLESDVAPIRCLVMRLVSNAYVSQLESAAELCETLGSISRLHKQGLNTLLEGDLLNCEQVAAMIEDKEPLLRKYGAIAAKRLVHKFPQLISVAASSADADVRSFSQEQLDMNDDESPQRKQ